jgi:ribose transport system permease protein
MSAEGNRSPSGGPLGVVARARGLAGPGLGVWTGPAWIWVLLAVAVAIAAVTADSFFTVRNLTNVLRQASPLAVVSIGQTAVILARGIDISVAPNIAMSNTLAMGIMNGHDERIPQAFAVALAAGAVIGLVNGLLVAKTRVPAFIVTLGVGSVVQGTTFLYTNYGPFGSAAPALSQVGFGEVGPLPILVLLILPLIAVALVVQNKTVFGRHLYAVGDDDRVARLAGVANDRTKVTAYVICGLMAALTGVLLTTRTGTGEPLAGTGFDWDSIAAVVIGGTVLSGGRGGVGGTLAGVLVISAMNNVMNLLEISPYVQFVAKGSIILLATVLSATVVLGWLKRARRLRLRSLNPRPGPGAGG